MWCDVLSQEIKNFYDIRNQLMNHINAQATAKTATSAAEVRTTAPPGRRSSLFVVWFSVLFYRFTRGLVVLEVIYFRRWDTPASQALHLSIDAFTGTPPAIEWKCPPDRPRRTWLQQVEEDMGLPSVPVNSRGTLDRSLWRSLRPSAGQAQQWVSEWVREL